MSDIKVDSDDQAKWIAKLERRYEEAAAKVAEDYGVSREALERGEAQVIKVVQDKLQKDDTRRAQQRKPISKAEVLREPLSDEVTALKQEIVNKMAQERFRMMRGGDETQTDKS